MKDIFTQLLTAFLGSMGFALMFGIRTRHILSASLGGLFSWGIYLACFAMKENVFLACLAASIFSMLYAEFMARRRKCPATIFVITAIIPLVPGSSLYYAMSYAVNGDFYNAGIFTHKTLIWVLAISAGISFTTAFQELFSKRSK